MVKLSIKFVSLALLLIFGVLLGMNMAEKGIYKVAGASESKVESFFVSQKENKVEVKVLGKSYISELPKKITIDSRKEPEEETKPKEIKKNIGFVSNLGNQLGSIFQIGAEKGLGILASLMD